MPGYFHHLNIRFRYQNLHFWSLLFIEVIKKNSLENIVKQKYDSSIEKKLSKNVSQFRKNINFNLSENV